MKKNVQEVIKETTNKVLLEYFIMGIKYTVYSLLFVLLVVDVILSQSINPLYFKFTNEDVNSVVTVLKRIQSLPEFGNVLSSQEKIYGPQLKQAVFADHERRQATIQNLESALQKNPQSRDVLYALYLLNEQDGNSIQAQAYLTKAKAIDPAMQAR